jgi:hypothetical protein
MGAATEARIDGMAVVVGALRLASGVSFLVAPESANRLWGDDEEPDTTASLRCARWLPRRAHRRAAADQCAAAGPATAGWFLASAGADAPTSSVGWPTTTA